MICFSGADYLVESFEYFSDFRGVVVERFFELSHVGVNMTEIIAKLMLIDRFYMLQQLLQAKVLIKASCSKLMRSVRQLLYLFSIFIQLLYNILNHYKWEEGEGDGIKREVGLENYCFWKYNILKIGMSGNKEKRIKVFGFSERNKSRKKETSILVLDQSKRSRKNEIIPTDPMLIQSNNLFDSYKMSPRKQEAQIYMQDNELQKYLGLVSESEIENDQYNKHNFDSPYQSKQVNGGQEYASQAFSSLSRKLQESPEIIQEENTNRNQSINSISADRRKQLKIKEFLFQVDSQVYQNDFESVRGKKMTDSVKISLKNQVKSSKEIFSNRNIQNFNQKSKSEKELKASSHQKGGQMIKQSIIKSFLQQKQEQSGHQYGLSKKESPIKAFQQQQFLDRYSTNKKKPTDNISSKQQSQQKGQNNQKSLKSYLAIQEDYGKQIQTMINKYEKVAELKEKTQILNKEIQKLTYKKTNSLNKDYYFDYSCQEGTFPREKPHQMMKTVYKTTQNWQKGRNSRNVDEQLKQELLNMQNLIYKFRQISVQLNNSDYAQKNTSKDEIDQLQSRCLQSNLSPLSSMRGINPFSHHINTQEKDCLQNNSKVSELKWQNDRLADRERIIEDDGYKINQAIQSKFNLKNQSKESHTPCLLNYNALISEINGLKNKIIVLQSERVSQDKQIINISPISLQSHQKQQSSKEGAQDSLNLKLKAVCTRGTQETIRKIQGMSKKKQEKEEVQPGKQLYTQYGNDDYDTKVILSKYSSQPNLKKSSFKAELNLKIPQRPRISTSVNKLTLNFPQVQSFPRHSSSQQELIHFGEFMFSTFYKFLAQHFEQKFKEPKGNYKIKKYADCIHYQIANALDCHLIYYFKGKLYFGQVICLKQEFLKHGLGFYWNRKKYKYAGQFKQDKKHGQGTINYLNGDHYSGLWNSGRKSGQGVQLNKAGDLFEGNFSHGKKQGKGLQLLANGDVYQGQFIDGKLEGNGSYWWKDGAFYRGTFKDGLLHGKGLWISKENDYYEGQYRQNKKHGIGTYRWSNGAFLSGKFIDDIHSPPLWSSISSSNSRASLISKAK